MHEYNIALSSKESDVTISISGKFNDEDWERLELFTQYANGLLETKLVQNGMPASATMHWNQESGMEIITNLPDWDDVIVFLHKFRPIGLETESTYFYKICSILTKEFDNPYFREMIKIQKDIYNGKRLRKIYTVSSNETVLNSDKVLSDWLNAYEYHRNKKKQEYIQSLHTMIPIDLSKVHFIALLSEKMLAIQEITLLVQLAMGKKTHIVVNMKPPNPK